MPLGDQLEMQSFTQVLLREARILLRAMFFLLLAPESSAGS